MIDYRVKTFLALCDFMNYRKTAQILNMTQPAVTQHIHFLENQYGCKLFDYDRHSLKMTREGMLLKRYCESVMYQEEKLFERLSRVKNDLCGLVRQRQSENMLSRNRWKDFCSCPITMLKLRLTTQGICLIN